MTYRTMKPMLRAYSTVGGR